MELKVTTTVAMDFGRITLRDNLVVYLFGTPGQKRFWFMWDELATGALGTVVLADTRRLTDCFSAIDYFERNEMPFIVAVNCFDGAQRYPAEALQAEHALRRHGAREVERLGSDRYAARLRDPGS